MNERPRSFPAPGTITQDHTKGARLVEIDPFEDALASCARAIGGRSDLKVVFGVQQEDADPASGRLARPPPDVPAARRAVLRGEADLVGLYGAHHKRSTDEAQALDLWPQLALAALERVRIEALGSERLKGVAANLAAALLDRCLKPRFSAGVSPNLRAEALAMLVREQIAPAVVPARSFAFVERYRAALSAAVSSHVERLRGALADQDLYAHAALALAAAVPSSDSIAHISRGAATEGVDAKGDSDPGPVQGKDRSEGEAAGLKSATEEAVSDAPLFGTPEKTDARGGDDGSPSQSVEDEGYESGRLRARRGPSQDLGYRIFTTTFDRIATARSLLAEIGTNSPAKGLAETPADRRQEISRLAGRLRSLLMAQQPHGWARDMEEGELDPRTLPRVISSPASGRFFRQRKDEPFNDTVVTLLLDNSSSMRGDPLKIAALSAELVTRAVESCGVRVEVLGFTTQSWRGGRARTAWLEAGQPADPGRVSELLHIIYKRADEGVRGLRNALSLMTLKGLHKENVDGEALQWAHSRMLARPEKRRILIVVSDGAPSEETTLSLSQSAGNCLETHLRSVIADIGRRRLVELFAIGIDYDVEKLYPDAVRIDEADGIARALVDALPRLMAKSAAPKTAAFGAGVARPSFVP